MARDILNVLAHGGNSFNAFSAGAEARQGQEFNKLRQEGLQQGIEQQKRVNTLADDDRKHQEDLAGAERILASPRPAEALRQLFPHLYRDGVTDQEVIEGAKQVRDEAMMKLGQVAKAPSPLSDPGRVGADVRNGFLTDEQAQNALAPKPPAPFNLGPGETRYSGDGQPIASRPAAPEKPVAQFRPMTPEEIKAAGLGDGTAAQKNDQTGQIQVLSQPKQAAGGVTPNQAWNVWQTARKGLVDALGKTNTGPIAGRMLKYTSGGQVARGGVAAVAPIMKDLFRKAGEGTFTEGDQKLLMDMLPTETTDESAREEILKNIDNIISAKLGIAPQATGQNTGQPVQVRSIQEARGLPKGTVFITPDGKRKVR